MADCFCWGGTILERVDLIEEYTSLVIWMKNLIIGLLMEVGTLNLMPKLYLYAWDVDLDACYQERENRSERSNCSWKCVSRLNVKICFSLPVLMDSRWLVADCWKIEPYHTPMDDWDDLQELLTLRGWSDMRSYRLLVYWKDLRIVHLHKPENHQSRGCLLVHGLVTGDLRLMSSRLTYSIATEKGCLLVHEIGVRSIRISYT